MSWGDWLPTHSAAWSLVEQAASLARQLGHTLPDQWSPWPKAAGPDTARYWTVICRRCGEHAIVRPRSWHGAAMSGVVVTFRCRGS